MTKLFRSLLFTLVLGSALNTFAQPDSDFPTLTEADIPNGKIVRAEYFPGDALWGIINGGADIYLEYGFDKLLLQEIEWKQINFRVEFYRMTDPVSAFGIYSVSHFKCNSSDTISKYVCITPFQVQCALGRFYVSIANDKGNKDAEQLTIKLFQIVLSKSKESLFEIPERFSKPVFAPRIKNLKVIKGMLGFQNGFPVWSEKFEKFSKYTVYLLPEEIENNFSYSAIIHFDSPADMKRFVNENQKNASKSVSEKELLFYESNKVDTEILKQFFN